MEERKNNDCGAKHEADHCNRAMKKVCDFASKKCAQLMHGSSLNTKDSDGTSSNKRALLCVMPGAWTDDVKDMRDSLRKKFGYPAHCIRVLTEFEPEEFHPTKENIEKSLRWLVDDCKEGGELMFYFTRHCVRQSDSRNDIDFTIVRPPKQGVRLYAIVDDCHSGTTLDLEYIYDPERKQWKDNRPPSGAPRNTGGGSAICLRAFHDTASTGETNTPLCGALTWLITDLMKTRTNVVVGQLLEIFAKTRRCETSEFAAACRFKNSQKLVLSSSSREFEINFPIFTSN